MSQLQEEDRVLVYGELGNYSITGIEIQFNRHKFKYVYVYYLPSGETINATFVQHDPSIQLQTCVLRVLAHFPQ